MVRIHLTFSARSYRECQTGSVTSKAGLRQQDVMPSQHINAVTHLFQLAREVVHQGLHRINTPRSACALPITLLIPNLPPPRPPWR